MSDWQRSMKKSDVVLKRRFSIALTLTVVIIFDIAGASFFPRIDSNVSFLGYPGYEGGGVLGMMIGLLVSLSLLLLIRFVEKQRE